MTARVLGTGPCPGGCNSHRDVVGGDDQPPRVEPHFDRGDELCRGGAMRRVARGRRRRWRAAR